MTTPEKNYNKSMNSARHKLSEWYMAHKKEYASFLKEIENAENGNWNIYAKIFNMAIEFIPPMVISQCKRLFDSNCELSKVEKDFEEAYAELEQISGYLRIGIDSNEEIERLKSLPDDADEGSIVPFEGDEEVGVLSHLCIAVVPEKDDADKQHYYLHIKSAEELWSGLPIMLQMGLQFMLGKSGKELGDYFRRIIMAFAISASDMYERMQERLSKDTDNQLLHCVLYYISLDGGLVKSAKHLGSLFQSSKGMIQAMMFAPTIIGKMTEASVKYGHDKKSDWDELRDSDDTEISTEVKHMLADTKGKQGRRMLETETYNLNSMLIGNKREIKKLIMEYRKAYPSTTYLSYLLATLVAAGCISKQTPYPHFHHAIEALDGKCYDMDRVSRMYNYMYYNKEEFMESRQPKWITGRTIIHNWTKSFGECK